MQIIFDAMPGEGLFASNILNRTSRESLAEQALLNNCFQMKKRACGPLLDGFMECSGPRGLFAGGLEPGEARELGGVVAGGHGDVGKALVVQVFGDIFAFDALSEFGVYI